jgi:hypothetical protein
MTTEWPVTFEKLSYNCGISDQYAKSGVATEKPFAYF